jgi:hypothetical protein
VSEPRILTVDFVTERLTRGAPRWLVHHIDQDGAGHSYVFPKSTLEWRAAEYGLSDVDEILDMVLHEPYLPDAPDRDDAALRVGLVTSAGREAEPITLFNAASTADARAAHSLRIADVKATRALVSPTRGKNPLDAIRLNHGITTRGVRAKREQVDTTRWQLVYGALPVLPPPLISPSSMLEVSRA